jgi:predicted phage terminase large subunit-like protein
MKLLVDSVLVNPWIPNDPHPQQSEFLTLLTPTGETVKEAFYGGAAGGGKSEALLMAAAQYVESAPYSALLLRRTFADLAQPGAIMDRAHFWWDATQAKWTEETKSWRFPSGSVIKFGHLEHPSALRNYMGAEYQFIGFDELTQFPLEMYRFLFSRLRRSATSQTPLRMRSASNPGGQGHDWVKQRFIVEGDNYGRIFVPARVDDNPSIDKASYIEALNELDPVTRSQFLEGNWDAAQQGTSFKRSWFQLLDARPREFSRLVRFWDTAASAPMPHSDVDWTVGLLMGRLPNNRYVILDIVRLQGTAQDVEATMRVVAKTDRIDYDSRVEICIEQEPGGSGKAMIEHYVTRVLPEYYVRGIRSTGSKIVRAAPLSAQTQAHNVSIVTGTYLSAFFDELDAFPFGSHDDHVDAASGAFRELSQGVQMRPASSRIRQLFNYRG